MNDYLKKVASFNRESAETSLPQIEKKISEIDTSRMSIDTRARDGTKDKEILDGLDTFGWNDVLDANKSNAFNIRKFIAKIFSWFKAPHITGNMTVDGKIFVNGGDVDARLDWDGSTTGVDKFRSFVVYSKANPRHQIGQITVSRRAGNYTETYISVRNPKLADPASHVNSLGVRVHDDASFTYDISSPAAFRSALGISDYVTSTGSDTASNATWTWRKWASGKIEAWCSYAPSSAVATTVWVSPIRHKDLTISIPSGVFSSTPGRVYGTSFNNQLWVVHAIGASTTSITCRFATLSSNNVIPYIRFYCTNS